MFEFFKLMWIMRRVDETYVRSKVGTGKKKITQEECETILATEQVGEQQ